MAYNYNVMNYYQSGGLMKRKLKTIFISLVILMFSFSTIEVKADSNSARSLLEKALNAKTFYHYNLAYEEVMKLDDIIERDQLLGKLSSIYSVVWSPEINGIYNTLLEMTKTASGKIYDKIQTDITSSVISQVDKDYLLGEVNSWGRKLVWTDDYSEGVKALTEAWHKKDINSITKAQEAIVKIKNQYSREYLSGELTVLNHMPEDEVERAVWYGFAPKTVIDNPNGTVTFSQFYIMIKDMIKLYDNSNANWLQQVLTEAENSKTEMYRSDGMAVLLCAATAMGINEMNHPQGDVLVLNRKIGDPWDDFNANHFDILKLDFNKLTIPWESDFEDCMQAYPAVYFFALGRVSLINGEMLFDYDNKSNSMRLGDPMTVAEAVRSVLRLYESTKKGAAVKKRDTAAEWDMKFLSSVEKRKESILDSKTSIVKGTSYVMGRTYSGTAYYVSNSGNDANNGKTPENAWATLDKVNDTALAYGDAVFFERGGTWYGSIYGKSGVTYSAYGKGNKPVISGSLGERAADPQKWSLAYTTSSGGKIWAYYRDLNECTGIFFDNGNKWGRRMTACWNGKFYVNDDGKPLDVSVALKEDLDYFPWVDIAVLPSVEATERSACTGPFYLRCDAGNPGEVFKKIEFSSGMCGFENYGNDVAVDNLCFLYHSISGVNITSYNGWVTGGIVQNCEVAWCGGALKGYKPQEDGLYEHGVFSGGGIQITGLNMTAQSNYVHHIANKGIIIHPLYAGDAVGNIAISGNLIEDSPTGLDIVNFIKDNPKFKMGKILYEDNYVVRTGYIWGTEQIDLSFGKGQQSSINFNNGWHNSNSGIYILNNVFYLADYALVYGGMGGADAPIFSGNTYVQNEKAPFAHWEENLISNIGKGNMAKEFIKDVLGDTKGIYIEVN